MKVFLTPKDSTDSQKLQSLLEKCPQIQPADLNSDDRFTVITNGPLTELSDMLIRDYKLKDRIERILLVGGTDSYGDVTMTAEKNIHADPKSAQHIFLSGIEIVMFGLNVTRELKERYKLPLAWLLDESAFETEECGVYVETKGPKALGMTVTDLYSDKQFDKHNVLLVKAVDLKRCSELLEKL